MRLEIEFQEAYKRLDKLCKELFLSETGVSTYIREMENAPAAYQNAAATWWSDYKELKHVRWVRNQLAHEVGAMDAGICTKEDLLYVREFYQRILKREDPYAVAAQSVERKTAKTKAPKKKKRAPWIVRFFKGIAKLLNW